MNGACVNLVNSYFCQCNYGYTGSQCQNLIDNCANGPCRNNAPCINKIGGFDCVCSWPFTGQICQNTINTCISSPCVFGTCQSLNGSFTCSCMTGK